MTMRETMTMRERFRLLDKLDTLVEKIKGAQIALLADNVPLLKTELEYVRGLVNETLPKEDTL